MSATTDKAQQALQSILNILQFPKNSLQEFLDHALDQAIHFTGSKFGYIYYYQEDKKQFVLNSWSKDVMKECEVMAPQTCYELDKTGIWGEAVRQRKPIIVNDFDTTNPLKKGVPKGHVHLNKFMTIPVFDKGNIVSVIGLANKESDYTQDDVLLLQLLMDGVWKVVNMKEAAASEKHLKNVLLGIRNVNQLIVSENNAAELIRTSCLNLTETFGYYNAWILLLDEQAHFKDFASAGEWGNCSGLEKLLKKGQHIQCVDQALQSAELIVVDQGSNCADCPLEVSSEDSAAMSYALRFDEKLYGVLTTWIPAKYIEVPEEQELFVEVANDIAFALHKIELEHERKILERNLAERVKEMSCILAISQDIQKDLPEDKLFSTLGTALKKGFSNPDKLLVNVEIGNEQYGDRGLDPKLETLTAIVVGAGRNIGAIRAAYIDGTDFLLPEEQHLLDNIAAMVSQWLEKRRAVARLKLSEENLSITLQSIGDAVLVTDAKGRVTRMNRIAEQLTGYKLEEALNKPITAVFHIINATSREVILNPVGKVLDTGRIVGLANHTLLISKQGKEYQISDSAAPIRNKENETVGVILVFSDVTRQYKQMQALAESERKFKSFFHTVPGAVSITAIKSGEYIDVNTAFEQVSEYTRDELIGKTAYEINIWDDIQDRERFVKELEKYGQVDNLEANFRTKSGKIIHGLLTASKTIIDGEHFIVLIVNDITQLYLTRLNLLKYNAALAQLPTGVFLTDLVFVIEYTNPIVSVLTGYKPEELMGKHLRTLIADDFFEKQQSSIKQLLQAGKKWHGEFKNKHKDGSTIWLRADISGVYDQSGKLVNYTVVAQDVTQEKAMHDQLLVAKERAEASDKLKSAFLNNISHEIRTPLNSILGFGELMVSENEYSLEERKEFFDILDQSSRRLVDTVTDYMDISLISSGNMEVNWATFDVNPLLHEIYENHSHKFTKGQVDFILQIPEDESVSLKSDPELLRKILNHLIGNALKFTLKGKVELGYHHKDEGITIFVNDTGIGIERELQQQVFEYFRQEKVTHTRGHEGSGLGLSIVKGLSELLKAKVELQSEKNVGTKINILLPLQNRSALSTTSKPTSTMENTNQEKALILIAEDEDTNFIVLDLFLRKKLAVNTLRANNGLEAVEACKNNPEIALVLMDIKMPVMDGIEATKQIKAFKPELIIIAITAYAVSGDEQKLRKIGCDDYIAKPIQKNDLLRKVKHYLGDADIAG
ncbi:MAG: PAS domain S-box protein [Bacteroidetes bacterium]|jgi:PAS domain S-box-containing protein|nr:PAS domain S-box protein [Bacteroidota bacterium]